MKLRNEVHEPSPLAFFRTLSKFSDSTKKMTFERIQFILYTKYFRNIRARGWRKISE